MALIDLKLPRPVAQAFRLARNAPDRQQLRVLKKLLKKARFTELGQQYRFDEILLSANPARKFQELARFVECLEPERSVFREDAAKVTGKPTCFAFLKVCCASQHQESFAES